MAEITSLRVVTRDADREVAPHKISSNLQKDSVEIGYRLTLAPGGLPGVAFRVELGGAGPETGRPLVRRYGVCSAEAVCDSQVPCGFTVQPDVDYGDVILQPWVADLADGDYPVYLYILTPDEGWVT